MRCALIETARVNILAVGYLSVPMTVGSGVTILFGIPLRRVLQLLCHFFRCDSFVITTELKMQCSRFVRMGSMHRLNLLIRFSINSRELYSRLFLSLVVKKKKQYCLRKTTPLS